LLKHDLLTDNNTVQADTRVYFQTLMSGLGCDYLAKLIYPTLYAFENYDHMAVTPQDAPVMPFLDRTTLAEHKNSVFLLDGFTHISVCATVDSLLVFPPPHKSEIRNIVKVLKQRAPLVSPHCTFVQEGTNDAEQWFFSKLVDTPLSMTEETFVQFQTKIAQEALAILNNE
jgi:hypothetical protein